jgi:glycosyltransferase involved in cell wall biosynthesis
MLISIGILAWNEESAIGPTLTSLFGQSALCATTDLPDFAWEVIVVPNGCSDRTAEVSRRILQEQVAQSGRRDITCSIQEIAEAGKSNAWNRYVHDFSARDAELIVMLDADIEFGQRETLSNTVKALLADTQAAAAVDLPLKDALKKTSRNLVERISVAASHVGANDPVGLSGQFFCARAALLRQIWMPRGLSVEDGFLAAMLLTNCMLSPSDNRRLIRAPAASHYYETLTALRAIFQHELRLVVGTALNSYLIWDFLLFATDPAGSGAGVLIRNQLENDPRWYAKLIDNSIRNRGWWVLPRGMLFRRFHGWHASRRGGNRARALAVALAGFMLDLPVFLAANRRIKKTSTIGYW